MNLVPTFFRKKSGSRLCDSKRRDSVVERHIDIVKAAGPIPATRTMQYVYILQSLVTHKYYIGTTNDVARRLVEHNSKLSKSTAPYIPYEIRLVEEYLTIEEAYKRERFIKNKKSAKIIKLIINN